MHSFSSFSLLRFIAPGVALIFFIKSALGETILMADTFEGYEGPLSQYNGSGQSGTMSPLKWQGSRQGTDAQNISQMEGGGGVLLLEGNRTGSFASFKEAFVESGRFSISFDTSPSGGNALYTFVRFGGSDAINEGLENDSIRIRFYSDGKISLSTGDADNLQSIYIPSSRSHLNVSQMEYVMNKVRIEVLTPDAFDGSGEVKVALFVNGEPVVINWGSNIASYTRSGGLTENHVSIGVQATSMTEGKGAFDNFLIVSSKESENPFPKE